MCGVLPPRLLQDHSPSGDLHYIALVQTRRGSGEALVNRRHTVIPSRGLFPSSSLPANWLVLLLLGMPYRHTLR